MTDYTTLTDEEVVLLAQQGDSGAIDYTLEKYKNLVRSKARSYFLIGADHEDIVQEGMIGLYKAVRDYKADRQASFKVFADLCVTRQIITAIKTATRQKHIPLNSYVSLNRPMYDSEGERTLLEVVKEDEDSNPETKVISREDIEAVKDKLSDMLTRFELEAFCGYIEGKSYTEISEQTGYHVKGIDNALQRVRRKLQKYMESKQ